MGAPNSISVRIERRPYRALVDTGAEVSVISCRVFKKMRPGLELQKRDIKLRTANGSPLYVEGLCRLQVKVGNKSTPHDFLIVKNLNRNVILGRDWLMQNGVRMYFDLGALKIGKEYVALEDDVHISSIIRLAKKITLKPQHLHTCTGLTKLRNKRGKEYEIEQLSSGYVSNLSGISVANAVVKIPKSRIFQLLIMNNTNQTITLKRGCPLAKLEKAGNITEITMPDKQNNKSSDVDLEQAHVPEEFKPKINKLLKRNRDLFVSDDKNLGRTDTVEMRIDTGTHEPIKKRPYRTPLKQRKTMDSAIDEMMQAGVIERSNSPWGFPVVLVEKKDGSKRFCVDFRALNKITKKYARPLPVIDDILASLGSARYFSKLDLKSGYWQVKLHDDDKEKSAFTCHKGLFHFNVMPFGLANAPGIFQELMSVVLQGQEDFALAYLDDILIFSNTVEDHIKHIDRVLSSLRKHNLKLKPAKCEFFKKETQYLGFNISKEGIQPDLDKVKAIKSVSTPTTVRQVRAFIGMTSYYRRFIRNFSDIAEPLVNLTRKYARFQWDDACQTAFDTLKTKLAEMVILAYPNPNKAYRLYTDASDQSIGACLTQMVYDKENRKDVEKPIYLLSHKLSDTQTRWSTIEKEAYAIHYALQKLNHYLHSATFTIYTDHRPLEHLLNSPIQNRKIQTWAMSMTGYNCSIQYLKGKENVCADLLSRAVDVKEDQVASPIDIDDRNYLVGAINSNLMEPEEFAFDENVENSSEAPERPTLQGIDIIREQESDKNILDLKMRLKNGRATKTEQKRYIVMDEVVYYLSQPDDEPLIRLYIPSHLRKRVLVQYHDESGHMGVDKTFHSIKQKYFWPCLLREINDFISKCIPCQTRNLKKQHPHIQECDFPPFPFAKIALDVSGPYPKTHSGNQYIVTFIDMYSGWPEAFAVPNKKAETVVHLLVDEIFPRFGTPLQLLTDNGPENVNKAMKKTLEDLNVHHVTTSFYHPQSNGKVERFHRTMHDVLAKKIGNNEQSWDVYINQMLAAIRFHVSETTKFSPYYLLYNRDVILPLDNILRPRRIYYGDEHHQLALQEMHRSFTLVRNNIRKARRTAIDKSRSKTKDTTLEVGDLVYYKNHHKKGKLDVRWRPYYVIIEKTGPVSYRIRDQLTGSVIKTHAEHLRAASIDEWKIPTSDRPLRKIVLAAPVESSDSDEESGAEKSDFPVHNYRNQREESDDESDVPLMERRIMTRRKTADKNVSTVDDEVRSGSIDNVSSTLKDDSSKFERSGSTYVDQGSSRESPSSEINVDVQMGQTSVRAKSTDGPADSTVDRNKKKEQLKSLVDLLADML